MHSPTAAVSEPDARAESGPPPGSERFATGLTVGIVALTLAAHALGAVPGLVPWLWGVHAYAFFPPVVLGAAVVTLLLACAAAWIAPQPLPRASAPAVALRWWVRIASATAALGLFWVLRARHLFLGDGFVLADSIPRTQTLHNFEPVMAQLQHAIWRVAAPLFARPGMTPDQVAARTAALGSATAGALFVLVVIALAGELLRAAAGTAEDRDVAAGSGPWIRTLLVLVLATQGYVQLFFGYVENYAWLALAIAYYLLTAFAFLNGRGSLLPVVVACCAGICLHLSAVALVPSLAVLIAWGAMEPRRRAAMVADLVAGAVVVVVLAMLLSLAGGGYDVIGTVLLIARLVTSGRGDPSGYLASARHARDFLNEVELIGPLGLWLFLGGLAGARWAGRIGAGRVFVIVLGLTWLAGFAIAGDSNLGYARNWDLLAPAGLVLTAAGAFLLLELTPRAAARRRVLELATAISVFHTAPWIALNASFERSFERFKTLPLGGGRTESTVGYWYATHGDLAQAERWLIKALDANAGNSRAHYLLGQVCMMTRRYSEAVAAFSAARVQRPDLEPFRLALIDALVRSDRGTAALAEVDTLLARDPTRARDWAIRGAILMQLGRSQAARDALERAFTLAPGAGTYRDIERQIDSPGGFAIVLDRWWPQLVEP